MLPASAERDPEGKQDQTDVEREALVGDVDLVVLELVAARHIAWREHLSDACQPGADAVALDVAGIFFR